MTKIKWSFEEHDYEAAYSYLSLIFNLEEVKILIEKLKASDITEFKAKDIFRASGLPLLSEDNYHVKKDLKKIKDGEYISPILLVKSPTLGKVIIADGYHRLCSIYQLNEDALIQCKLAE